jgi:hypothetical protein
VRATLIPDYPLKLSGMSGDNVVKSIAVLVKKGENVFEKTIPDGQPALIVAEQSGIRPLQPYTVYIAKKGITPKMAVVLMDEATRAEVMKGCQSRYLRADDIFKSNECISSHYIFIILHNGC